MVRITLFIYSIRLDGQTLDDETVEKIIEEIHEATENIRETVGEDLSKSLGISALLSNPKNILILL